MNKKDQVFDEKTLKMIYSTVDFFLDFDEEMVDRLNAKLWHGYELWHLERKKVLVEPLFKERPKLTEISDKDKKPWEWGSEGAPMVKRRR